MKTLNKAGMIRELARRNGISQHEAQSHVETLMECFAETLIVGGSITYRGLFSMRFVRWEQAGRGKLLGQVPKIVYKLSAKASQPLKALVVKQLAGK